MRLGIYGGTFSPPHKGHIEAAEAFSKEMRLDKLLIIPTFIPPHKTAIGDASPEDRLEMCRIAFSHIPHTEISDIEIMRGGKSYTYLTLEELKNDENELFFLCGTDMILTFDLWKRYEYIFSLATICYVRRECDENNSLKIKEKTEQYEKLGAKIAEIHLDINQISSSEIRADITRCAGDFLTFGVLDYIKKNDLYYKSFSEESICKLRESVKKLMSAKRFLHTLGVEAAAANISKHVAPNLNSRARVAALLHDVTKEISSVELIKKYALSPSEEDLSAPETLHAITAPPFITEHFPEFSDDGILFAVETHTVADPEMTLLGKIIFVADYIEEGRSIDNSHTLRHRLYSELESANNREEALKALDFAVLSSIDYTTEYLIKIGKKPHTKTSLLRNTVYNFRGQKYGNQKN